MPIERTPWYGRRKPGQKSGLWTGDGGPAARAAASGDPRGSSAVRVSRIDDPRPTPTTAKPRRSTTQKVVDVDGLSVRIVRRKGMKSVRLRVDDAGVCVVSGNPRVPEAELVRFVREKRAWVEAERARRAGSPSNVAATATAEDQRAWRAVVEPSVEALVAAWEPILGVRAGKLAYRNMKSKWGSCQPSTGRICINTRLALYPPECLEYVVVHELCHLREPNHGAGFKGLMDAVMPDWRQRAAKLKG